MLAVAEKTALIRIHGEQDTRTGKLVQGWPVVSFPFPFYNGPMQDILDKGVAPPEYVLQTQREREQLLSHWGIISDLQRRLFLELTENWTPSIDFRSFLAARSEGGVNLSSDLQSLFAKLREAKVGILLTQKTEEAGRIGHRMILTSEGDPRFWYYHLSEALNAASDSPTAPYLTEALLASKGQVIPAPLITSLNLGDINKKFMEEALGLKSIFSLPVQGSDKLLVTSRDLGRLMTWTGNKLRYRMGNTEVATAIARLMNSSLTEFQKRAGSKDALFWKGLCQAVHDNFEDLLADRKLRLDKDFIQAADIFLSYLNTQLEEARRQKEEGKEREQDMKQLEAIAKAASAENLVTPGEMDEHIATYKPKYGQVYPLFREDFLKLYTQLETKTGLPPLMAFPGGYIHRDNFFLVFHKRLEKLRLRIKDEFRGRMDYILRTGNRNNDLSFSDTSSLEQAVADFLEEKDPWMAEVVKKGRMVAEGLIHHGRLFLGAKTMEDLKPQMDRYFKSGSTTLKSLVYLFDVDAFALFEESFRKLSVFTQLFIRLSGRFNSYRDKYLLLSPHAHADAFKKTSALPSARDRSASFQAAKESRRTGSTQDTPMPRKKKPEAPPKPKTYTRREQEAAWNRFKDNISK